MQYIVFMFVVANVWNTVAERVLAMLPDCDTSASWLAFLSFGNICVVRARHGGVTTW